MVVPVDSKSRGLGSTPRGATKLMIYETKKHNKMSNDICIMFMQ
jgi:hypothetical protein